MNYNALLLLDKHRNHKTSFSLNSSGINQFSFLKHKTSYNINTHIKDNTKYKKCYSVKPYSYSMPKDIILKDIFNNSINYSNEFIKKYDLININNIYNNTSEDRKYIFDKIKKFILINHLNYNVFGKTIFLYDLLLFEKQKQNGKNKKFNIMNSVPNLLIAIIAFILILKFNKENNKIISLKQFMKKFEEKDENISLNEIYEIEILALQLIDYNLTFRTPFSFMELFLLNGIVFNEDYISSDLSLNIYELANETLENIMMNSNEYFKCNYCYLCCSVIMYVREKFKINGWPKALEINFDVNYQQFSDIYNFFFLKNKNNNYYSNDKNKNNIKRFYNCDIINISNLKSMSNIINVLKIMKTADRYRKIKGKINKFELLSNNKEEICKANKNNNMNLRALNKTKIEQNKNNNLGFFKSPGNLTMVKPLISNILTISNEGNTTINSNNINDNNKNEKEKNCDKNEQNQIKKGNDNNSNNVDVKNDEKINILKISNIIKTKSFNRYRKNINKNKKYIQENNNYNSNKNSYINNNSIINCNTDGYCSNIINQHFNKSPIKKENNSLFNYSDKNSEIKNELINRNININSYNKANKNHNPYYNKITNNRYYYNGHREKKINYELSNDSKKAPITFNLNKTSLNDFLYHKNENSKKKDIDIDNDNYFDNYNIKNKNENSNAPTCENSNIKLSSNDFSIRKSYCLKKKNIQNEIKTETKNSPKNEKNIIQYEKEGKKALEKNKSYNKLLNAKITFSDKTYNRKTGLRKFYKQKNLIENNQ